ncbi:MAG: molybdate ABC transporter substrate-binding protein [Desulfonatronovibrio sp.]
MPYLDWPEETVSRRDRFEPWYEQSSNICLDFHGDPADADLVVFSDGNHHMALKDCLECFQSQNRELSGIFYATTPPGPILKMIRTGGLQLGNLTLKVSPHIFISPPDILKGLQKDGLVQEYHAFVRNQGNVLLVKKDNPRNIKTVADLKRDGIKLFLSNPETEKSSYQNYYNTLKSLSGLNNFPDDLIRSGQVVFGKRIHHREAPQAVANEDADAAAVFYHLGLRYVRIFPDTFDIVSLGGSIKKPDPLPGNIIAETCIGLVQDGGKWGRQFISFMKSEKAMKIYRSHGLLPWDSWDNE